MLQLTTGTYLGLDRTAVAIVNLLNQDPDPDHAARALADRFAIPVERARADVDVVMASVLGLNAERLSRGRRPTLGGMAAVTRSWTRLTWSYRVSTLWVTVVVVGVEIGLKATTVATLARWMRVPLATDDTPPPEPGPDDLSALTSTERRMYGAVHWVLTRWLYDGTCLRRALALGWFLRARHPRLRLGVLNDEEMVAHAWIEVEGRAFNTQPVTRAFSNLSTRPDQDESLTSEDEGFL